MENPSLPLESLSMTKLLPLLGFTTSSLSTEVRVMEYKSGKKGLSISPLLTSDSNQDPGRLKKGTKNKGLILTIKPFS